MPVSQKQVRAIVDEILSSLDPGTFDHASVNWAHLHCCGADRYVDGRWHIVIEEADPAASEIQGEVEKQLLQKYNIWADVDTEW